MTSPYLIRGLISSFIYNVVRIICSYFRYIYFLLELIFYWYFWISDGVLAKSLDFSGGYVHRQLWTIGKCWPDPLQPRVWLSEHYPHLENLNGEFKLQLLECSNFLRLFFLAFGVCIRSILVYLHCAEILNSGLKIK